MTRYQRITDKLTAALQPTVLELRDISHTHAGHAHAGIETHFQLKIASPQFDGLSRVAQHQLVNQALATEFEDGPDGGLHALAITTISNT